MHTSPYTYRPENKSAHQPVTYDARRILRSISPDISVQVLVISHRLYPDDRKHTTLISVNSVRCLTWPFRKMFPKLGNIYMHVTPPGRIVSVYPTLWCVVSLTFFVCNSSHGVGLSTADAFRDVSVYKKSQRTSLNMTHQYLWLGRSPEAEVESHVCS